MRFFTILLVAYCVCGLAKTQSQSIAPADSILNQALRDAGKENKSVLIIFRASWCTWCHRLQQLITEDSLTQQLFNDHYIIRYLTVEEQNKTLENPGASTLLIKYNGYKSGIPFWLIFNASGRLLADSKLRRPGDKPADGENIGCPSTPEEINYFIDVLRKTSPLQSEDLEYIRKVFTGAKPAV